MLRTSAIIMFRRLYSARNDKSVVNEPAPAIKGKTTGMIVTESFGPSNLNISTPKIISIAITKITRAPATAKEEISTPKSVRIRSPTNKKSNNIVSE